MLADEIRPCHAKHTVSSLEGHQERARNDRNDQAISCRSQFLVLATQNPIKVNRTFIDAGSSAGQVFFFKVLRKISGAKGLREIVELTEGNPSAEDGKGNGKGSLLAARHALHRFRLWGVPWWIILSIWLWEGSCRQSLYPGGGKPACGAGS